MMHRIFCWGVLTLLACGGEASSSDDADPRGLGGTEVGTARQAICEDGTVPGCDECLADSTSSLGGYRTCWRCDFSSFEQECAAPPTVRATWEASVRIWTDSGALPYAQAPLVASLSFEHWETGWQVHSDPLSFPLESVSVRVDESSAASFDPQLGSIGLVLPVQIATSVTTLRPVFQLSTDGVMSPPNADSVSGHRLDADGNLSLVGEAQERIFGLLGVHFWLEISGPVRGAPMP